ncbi:MAG TPA: hypothetical protein VG147_04040 [Solirubrobacteraceae bacterium]|jgi:hypothetical protein|nr:hypothetical protein [Solirubrobacteraceae bacterium]
MRIGKRSFASRKRKIAGLCAFVLAGVIGVGAYAFTDGNTQANASGAGANSETVSGYETSNLHFLLKEGTAETAEFTAEKSEAKEAAATEAQIAVYKSGGTAVWTPCVAAAGTPVKFTCTFAKALSKTEIEEDTLQETIVTS